MKARTMKFVLLTMCCLIGLGCNIPASPEKESGVLPWSKLFGKIAYVYIGDESEHTLYLIDANSKTTRSLRSQWGDYGGDYLWPAWSFDGSKIAVGTRNIRIISSDSTLKASTDSVISLQNAQSSYPTFSPDGRITFFYRSYALDTTQIWVNNAPFLTGHRCYPTRAAWSPDGSYVVVSIVDSNVNAGLYKVDAHSKAMVPLIEAVGNFSGAVFTWPQVSPDGGMIAFTVERHGSTPPLSVWVMNADGSSRRWLTPDGVDDYHPAWSPDGTMIAFVRNFDLHAVSKDGTNIFRITQNKRAYYPVWTR